MHFPAEWTAQSAVLIAWPHAETDWAPRLPQVEATYVALAGAVCRFENLLICVPDANLESRVRGMLAEAGVPEERLHFAHVAYDDTWLRDSGPISLNSPKGFVLLDFHFTGWGGKFEAGSDDALVGNLLKLGRLNNVAAHQRIEFALEGGGIETDGEGTLLTTWHCLNERHPTLSREALTDALKTHLHQDRVLWLNHGYLEGDDTDAHIDTLARFAGPSRIVYQNCDDASDSHFAPLQAMASELHALRRKDGQAYECLPLPWPQPILDEGRRLAASYANFLIINGAVLMPAYDDPADAQAIDVLARAFPDREIVPIPCRPLIWQNGSLHCITMQLPEGLLNA